MKTLKNLAIIMLGVCVLTSLASCNKDKMDEYGADKKISKVYYSYQYSNGYSYPKTLVEKWNWNTDDLVESIENYNEDGGMELVIDFTYNEKHRVSRVDCFRYNIHLDYSYDQESKLMDKLDLFFGNQMLGTCSVTYKNDKMSQLTVTVYDDYFKKDAVVLNPISMLLPKQFSSRLIEFGNKLTQRNGKQAYTINIQLNWDHNNISSVLAQGMGEMISITAQYDNKNNPFYGFILGQPGGSGLTQNNPTLLTVTEDNDSETILATYQYDSDNYPTMVSEYSPNYPDNKETLYFEY